MPQTNYLPMFTASYPLLAKVQKPGGVTVLTTVGPGDVPNKPTYTAGTIQSAEGLLAAAEEEEARKANAAEAPEEEEIEEDDGNGGTVTRKRRKSSHRR